MSPQDRPPRDRGRLMRIGRPRISTLVLSGLFLAVLALYLWVRPNPVDTASPNQPRRHAQSRAHAEPHAHAAAHDSFAHAVPDQPDTVPGTVRVQPVPVGGVADGKRTGIGCAVGDAGPAVGPAGDQEHLARGGDRGGGGGGLHARLKSAGPRGIVVSVAPVP